MENKADYVRDLSQIRSMMERSSRFISLSGLSGISAGLCALAGAGAVYYQLHFGRFRQYRDFPMRSEAKSDPAFVQFCILVAALVLIIAFVSSVYFTTRKARAEGQKIFDRTAKRLLINTLLPLVTGGVFCLALLYHGAAGLIAPAMLVFYGLALINGSKYTLDDIRYLGFGELALGIISAFFIGYGLVFWSIGFGLLHIVYGVVMYNKYDRK